MNIVIITQIYPQPDDIGDDKPTNTVENFAHEWVIDGHRVFVIHCPSKFPFLYYFMPVSVKKKVSNRNNTTTPSVASRCDLYHENLGIQIFRMPMLKILPGQSYSVTIMKKQTRKIISTLLKYNFKPDIILGHFANPSLELVVNLAEQYNIPSSIVFHHDCTEKNIKKYRINSLIMRVGVVGTRSIIEALNVQKRLSLKKQPFICYSGVPNELVESCEKTCYKHSFYNGVRYLYVGSMMKRKHLDAVIKAFVSENQERNLKSILEIVGSGHEEANLRQLVLDLNAEDIIYFLGNLPRQEVQKKMQEANIFTMISHSEAFGMVYIEAMLQGCIVIASKGEGFDGIIQDGFNGFLCEPGNTELLKTIYKNIQSMHVEDRNMIGKNAINTALSFSDSEVARKYLSDVIALNSANYN